MRYVYILDAILMWTSRPFARELNQIYTEIGVQRPVYHIYIVSERIYWIFRTTSILQIGHRYVFLCAMCVQQ